MTAHLSLFCKVFEVREQEAAVAGAASKLQGWCASPSRRRCDGASLAVQEPSAPWLQVKLLEAILSWGFELYSPPQSFFNY